MAICDDAGHGLDIVDDRRLVERAFDGRERRLDPRPGSLAFQAFDQPGLFAADVGRRAAMHVNIEREIGAADVLAQIAGLVAFVDGRLQTLIAQRVFVADVEIGRRGPGSVGAEDDAFDNLVRILLHQDAVVECARLALVGVDAHVDGAGMILRQEGPLQPGGKTGPAASAQVAGLDGLHELGRVAFGQHFLRAA